MLEIHISYKYPNSAQTRTARQRLSPAVASTTGDPRPKQGAYNRQHLVWRGQRHVPPAEAGECCPHPRPAAALPRSGPRKNLTSPGAWSIPAQQGG